MALTASEQRLVETLVSHYVANRQFIRRFLDGLHAHILGCIAEGGPLFELVHSVKHRMKDPEHLRLKLVRKLEEARARNESFDVNEENLFLKVNDLAGYRILHLHTRQAASIHPVLLEVLDQAQFDLFEAPFAHIWDEESRTFFEGVGIKAEVNPRLYSSVHYVVKSRSKKDVTCEIQVRTLADEIWGEVDHKINYPEPNQSLPCREQIRVLARVASSCSRLVDSIMFTDEEYASRRPQAALYQPIATVETSPGTTDDRTAGPVSDSSQPATPSGPRET
jgi:ppGpp synthetase/RelA/SpoT-type nucleotidyltranferase